MGFVTLMELVQSMFTCVGIDVGHIRLRSELWADCVSSTTQLDNVIVDKEDEKNNEEKCHGKKLKIIVGLHIFG